ncbi:hypothetical protein [Deinococcus maricopensis]|uniref:Uncharacterized protein n=1 Tax=Deinococcus maricopensis (strain DSM 21211 / LMG 22137 / NRRL B-23946 / LB-34) TaxID=709986 RepID=E8U3V2_DEIML|nr:hypothetical protein [Deinococcus maricopensis]ADV68795.1 hypothetical protein Deima_3167 [Deinococcus maricopensis DSM 21211]
MSITFIDSVMGSGKSTYAIKYINQHKYTTKIIVASPILDEVDRYAHNCGIQQPLDIPSKASNLRRLLQRGESVSISHALLLNIDEGMLGEIKAQGYELILDEVIADAINVHYTNKDTLETMVRAGLVNVDPDTQKITWLEAEDYEDHMDVRDACREGEVYAVDNQYIVSHLNTSIFEAFSKVQIMTYMAPYSMLAKLFMVKSVPFNIATLDQGRVVFQTPMYSGKQFASLIHLDNTPRRQLNFKLSVSGQGKLSKTKRNRLSSYTNGFFTRYGKGVRRSERIWTTYRAYAEALVPTGTRPQFDMNNFVQHSAKGTNQYSNASVAAYLVDKHPHPAVEKYLVKHRVPFARGTKSVPGDQGLWALSEMIQWIWRTRIRNKESIRLYVPSKRMKKLLEGWLQ